MSNGKRGFVPRDQVSPLLVVLLFIICTHKLVASSNFFIHKSCFESFSSADFLFPEILNLNLAFVVYVKLKLSIMMFLGLLSTLILWAFSSKTHRCENAVEDRSKQKRIRIVLEWTVENDDRKYRRRVCFKHAHRVQLTSQREHSVKFCRFRTF